MTGLELAFEHSGCFLERFLFFQVSENTVGKETECFGQLQTEFEASHKEGSQSSDYLQERLGYDDQPPERVYGALEGAKVGIEKCQKTAQPAAMGSEKEKWCEIKVGCWYGSEAVPKSQQRHRQPKKTEVCQQALRTRDMSYYCEIDTSEMFGNIFWASGCQRQADLAAEVVFVCDGGGRIWGLIELYYPQATQIVDWFHAEEGLEKAGQEALSGESAQEWLERVRTCLLEGDTSFVIRVELTRYGRQW